MRYKISYVLPVYNCEATIAECINSLTNQVVKGEIIVIDDCSTDRTPDLLKFYKDKGLIKIITNTRRKGAGYSRNLGNDAARGDIIAVCDVDYYYKYRGEAILDFFDKNEGKDVFYAASHLRDKNNIMDKYINDAVEWDFKSKCPISHPTVAYTSEVAEKVRYKELSVDTDLYEFFLLDAHTKGFKFGGTQHPCMLKVDGNSPRNVEEAKKLKRKLYSVYGIKI